MAGIAAQVSLYPLGQGSLSPSINYALEVFHQHGLDPQPGSMSTVIAGDDEAVFAALKEAFQHAAAESPVVMTVTFSNACPAPAKEH